MKQWFVKQVLKLALVLLLRGISTHRLLALVEDAERSHQHPFSRRGAVYRALKEIARDGRSTAELNLLVEMGVHLARLEGLQKTTP